MTSLLDHLAAMECAERPCGILAGVGFGGGDERLDERVGRGLADIHEGGGGFFAESEFVAVRRVGFAVLGDFDLSCVAQQID